MLSIQGTEGAHLARLASEALLLRIAAFMHVTNMVVDISRFILEKHSRTPERVYASPLTLSPLLEGSMTNLWLSYGHQSQIRKSVDK